MAGAADREKESPGNRDGELVSLVLTETVECPQCGTVFEADFVFDGVYDREMIGDVERPWADVECPTSHCRYEWQVEYSGWTASTDAG